MSRSSHLPPSVPSLLSSPGSLATGRLVLRPWTAGEVADVLAGRRRAQWADDFPAEGDGVIAGVVAAQLAEDPAGPGAHGHRLMVERGSGAVVGSISLFWPPRGGSVEFGYGVVASRRGRGYAPEAARALVAHALALPGVTEVRAEAELANPASVRVLEKAGLHRVGSDGGTVRYRATAPEGR
ncbi:GNAT family N-acetyltransferase [Streptomyces sp. NPDC050703]|uniref:GNAT family N-acetyltransferase n=1 Tax=Streptomyces sp. NPDC050703 TaxID=3157218 RepID=UPI003422F84E